MVFSTASFLYAFLPAFLLCYLLLPWKNAVALFFSLLFFCWGEGVYVLLLLGVVALNYVVGRQLARVDTHETRIAVLSVGVAGDLLVLGYYKYFGFIVNALLGLDVEAESLPQLPLGISFFIFQSISYLVDVYRRDAQPANSFFDLALYIAMFPQLIAGPIVRYQSVASALQERRVSLADVGRGIQLFALGLAYKMLLANHCAEVADAVFARDTSALSRSAAWLGVAAYTLQIFFDFAGYSLMAIGLGRVIGFRFPRNFNYPYVSRSITEFWRRWHLSLSSWFRDYLYIPLGGNRRGAARTYANLFIVFFLCGLWHGAAWTFVAWGMFHGCLLVVERAGLGRALGRVPAAFAYIYTLGMVMIGWALFRAEDFAQAGGILGRMFLPAVANATVYPAQVLSNENMIIMIFAAFMCLPWLEKTRWRSWDEADDQLQPRSPLTVGVDALVILLLLALCSVFVMSGTYNPFIYFRF